MQSDIPFCPHSITGYISYANIHVNAISYVQIIMSIGMFLFLALSLAYAYHTEKMSIY